MEERPVTLVDLAGGAALELFDREFQAVLKNIQDPNTEARAIREVTLKVKITPSAERTVGTVAIIPSSKLAPTRMAGTTIYMGRRGGQHFAVEHDPRQLTIPAEIVPVGRPADPEA